MKSRRPDRYGDPFWSVSLILWSEQVIQIEGDNCVKLSARFGVVNEEQEDREEEAN